LTIEWKEYDPQEKKLFEEDNEIPPFWLEKKKKIMA